MTQPPELLPVAEVDREAATAVGVHIDAQATLQHPSTLALQSGGAYTGDQKGDRE